MKNPKPEPRLAPPAECTLCGYRYPAMLGRELTALHGEHCNKMHPSKGSVSVKMKAAK